MLYLREFDPLLCVRRCGYERERDSQLLRVLEAKLCAAYHSALTLRHFVSTVWVRRLDVWEVGDPGFRYICCDMSSDLPSCHLACPARPSCPHYFYFLCQPFSCADVSDSGFRFDLLLSACRNLSSPLRCWLPTPWTQARKSAASAS